MPYIAYPIEGLTMPETWGDSAILYDLDHDLFGLTPKAYGEWDKTALSKRTIKVTHNERGLVFDIPQEVALTYFLGKKQAQFIDAVDGPMECLLVYCK